jgi:PadR family transcriptional regulator
MDLRRQLGLLLLTTRRRLGTVHGYALITSFRGSSEGAFDLPEGTVFPVLHRFERDGLVSSEWQPHPPTDASAASLPAASRPWRPKGRSGRCLRGMQAVLRAYLRAARSSGEARA